MEGSLHPNFRSNTAVFSVNGKVSSSSWSSILSFPVLVSRLRCYGGASGQTLPMASKISVSDAVEDGLIFCSLVGTAAANETVSS